MHPLETHVKQLSEIRWKRELRRKHPDQEGSKMHRISEVIAEVPTWMKVTGVFVMLELSGTTLAFCLGRPDVGVLAFQAIPTTVLVGITYKYARSTADMAKLTREQLSFLETQASEQKRAVFEEVLTELVDALRQKRPPFNLSRWERYEARLVHSPKLAREEVGAVALAYVHLKAANEHTERRIEQSQKLGGAASIPQSLLFQPLNDQDESLVQTARRVLRRVLDEWDQGRKEKTLS